MRIVGGSTAYTIVEEGVGVGCYIDAFVVRDDSNSIVAMVYGNKLYEPYEPNDKPNDKPNDIIDIIVFLPADRNYIAKVMKELKKDETFIQFVEDRKGHDRRYSINFDKLKKMGWKTKHNFEDALRKTIQWYKENEWWWKPLKNYQNYSKSPIF